MFILTCSYVLVNLKITRPVLIKKENKYKLNDAGYEENYCKI